MLSASKSGSASGASGYNLTRSLRTRASASASLTRTPAASNRQIWTWSGWVKRGVLNNVSTQSLFGATADVDNFCQLRFTDSSNSPLQFAYVVGGNDSQRILTTAVYRDPSAWYHIVLAIDTTQATAANRMKLYVNGSQVTAFSYASYPSQNANMWVNAAIPHGIAVTPSVGGNFDGYLAEVNFIDGQALTPSSFGSTNALTGVWQPAAYTGTYGTNGFYLPFTDNSALTTSSNVGLGKDFSGNGNYWTTNNISITAGVTYDSMTDVPTLTSATAANFAVMNPITGSATLSNGNLAYTSLSGAYYATIGTIGVSSGKWYWEFTANGAGQDVGICGINNRGQQGVYVGSTSDSYGYYGGTGNKYNNGSASAYGATYTTNDVIGIALDMNAGTLVFYKNNTSQGTAYSSLSGTFFPMGSNDSASAGAGTFNFGQRPFTYTPPTGFVALNTYNLPTSTIVKGNTVMDATLYTGTLLSNAITNAASFKPDLVWVKSRSAATDNKLTDSVRGVTKGLISNTTGAETTDTQGLTAFGSAGFTVGTNTDYNNLAATYVAWQWQAGQGSSSSNTNGTITSTVSVNASAGFSIVTYTGNGTNGATVGHGLGVKPSLIIEKGRTSTYNWPVQGCGVLWSTATQTLFLNNTSALNPGSGYAVPTSSVFTPSVVAYANESGVGNMLPTAGHLLPDTQRLVVIWGMAQMMDLLYTQVLDQSL